MTTLNEQARRLRADLDRAASLGGPQSPQSAASLLNQVASVAFAALQDKGHPLAQKLDELLTLIDPDLLKDNPNEGRFTRKHLFLPLPAMGSREWRSFWPLQLLLSVIAQSPKLADLSNLLQMGKDPVIKAAEEAWKIDPKSTTAQSTIPWGSPQFWSHLAKATEFLA